MANTKPRWGWYQHWPDHPEVENWKAVFDCVDALNPGWTAELKHGTAEIEAEVGFYFFSKYSDTPTNAEIKSAAREINRDVKRLLEKVEAADEMTRMSLEARYINGPGPIDWSVASSQREDQLLTEPSEPKIIDMSPRPYEVFVEDLTKFEIASKELSESKRLQSRSRTGRSLALENLIGSFAGCYEEATSCRADDKITFDKETKEYWSPFISFLSNLLDLIEKDHGYTNLAIGDAVRRYFGKRK